MILSISNFISALIQTSITMAELFGFLILFGLLLGYLRNLSVKNIISSCGFAGIILTAPGVILHELSHYIFAKLFGCSIHEVKLFRPIEGMKDGILGYVNFSYNKNSIFHKIGLFFIGFAPIFGGTFAVFFSMKLLLPDIYIGFIENIRTYLNTQSFFSIDFLIMQLNISKNLFSALFLHPEIHNLNFWIFIYIIICVSSHIALSHADLKGSYSGLFTIFMLIFIINIIFPYLRLKISSFSNILNFYNIMSITLLTIMLTFSFIYMIITFILKLVFSGCRN